jgi:hypothetical protein
MWKKKCRARFSSSVCALNGASHTIQFFHCSLPVNFLGLPSGQCVSGLIVQARTNCRAGSRRRAAANMCLTQELVQ